MKHTAAALRRLGAAAAAATIALSGLAAAHADAATRDPRTGLMGRTGLYVTGQLDGARHDHGRHLGQMFDRPTADLWRAVGRAARSR